MDQKLHLKLTKLVYCIGVDFRMIKYTIIPKKNVIDERVSPTAT